MTNIKLRNFSITVLLAVLPILYSYFYKNILSLCGSSDKCQDFIAYNFNSTMLVTPLFLAVIFLTLLFFSVSIYKKWRKFAFYVIPLMLLWIFLTPVDPSCDRISICYDRSFVVFVSGFLYVVSSLVVIIRVASLEKKSLVTPK